MTDNHSYNTPSQGQTDWHVPINENFVMLDIDAVVVDAEANRDQYTPHQNALFVASDTGRRFVGDSSQWVEVPSPSGAGGGIDDGSDSSGDLRENDFAGVPDYPPNFTGSEPESISMDDVLLNGTSSTEFRSIEDTIAGLYE